MTISVVQSVTGAGATVVINNVVSGNALVVIESYFKANFTQLTPSTPTDSVGAAFTAAEVPLSQAFGAADQMGVAAWVKENATAGTHTITPYAPESKNVTVIEVSGLLSSSSLDVHTNASTASSSHTSQITGTTSTSSQANEIVFIGLGLAANGGVADVGFTDPVTGFTTLQKVSNDLSDIGTFHAYKIVSATGTQGATFNWTDAEGGQVSQAIVFTLKGSSGSYTLTAAQGSYSLTGQAANLLVSKLLVADQGSYALTGQAANLSYSAAGRTLIADTGFYTLVGSDALVDLGMNAEFGTYNLTGQDAILTYAPLNSYTLVAASGTYNLNGQDANLLMGRVLPCVSGQYNLTGFASGLTWSGAAASGAYHGKIHMGLSDLRL